MFPKGCTSSQNHVLSANFVKIGWPEIGKVVRCLPDKKKQNFRKVSRSRFCMRGSLPKSVRASSKQYTRSFPKFHPNPFTFGGVIAERVNILETRHKVFPILGEASSPSKKPSKEADGHRGVPAITIAIFKNLVLRDLDLDLPTHQVRLKSEKNTFCERMYGQKDGRTYTDRDGRTEFQSIRSSPGDDLKIGVISGYSHWRWLTMSLFDRTHTTSCSPFVEIMSISCTVFATWRVSYRKSHFFYPTCIWSPLGPGGNSIGILSMYLASDNYPVMI